ncbi:MAG: SUMF1/EgtB/PvdO family nonheme iron enzyme [Blastochloris sp.]|nr:SUMF1/EgtB/PvdO family nonheme iron enzyme [Blastochloris sp.]
MNPFQYPRDSTHDEAPKEKLCLEVSDIAEWVEYLCAQHDHSPTEDKVASFGISSSISDSIRQIFTNQARGKSHQHLSAEHLDDTIDTTADDIYFLGATFYELISGEAPYRTGDECNDSEKLHPESMTKRRQLLGLVGEEIPQEWEETILACLDSDPSKRPQSANEVTVRLKLNTQIIKKAATSIKKAANKKQLLIRIFIITGVLLLLLATYGTWYGLNVIVEKYQIEEQAKLDAEKKKIEEKANEEAQAKAAKEEAERFRLEAEKAGLAEAEKVRLEAERLANAKGTLTVRTAPSEVTVKLGVENLPLTSADLKALKIGTYQVTLSLEGYEPVVREVKIMENETTDLGMIKLIRQTGSVALTSVPSGAAVFSNEREIGKTPLIMKDVPTGSVSYQLTFKGYEVTLSNLIVKSKQQKNLEVKLEKLNNPVRGQNFTAGNGMKMNWVAPLKIWVGVYEVTQEEYKMVMGVNPSEFQGTRKPVEKVNWNEAQDFCLKLTNADRASGLLPESMKYQLPTERQWELFVADTRLRDAVTTETRERTTTENVGSLGNNQYGLYDLRGNVSEWCEDIYKPSENWRTLRGASWNNSNPTQLDLSYRFFSEPNERSYDVGFRVVMSTGSAAEN